MKIKIKTEKVLEAFNILKAATYQKLDDADKIKLWKIARVMKPIATKFEEDSKDATEKLKPEGFDEKLANAQEYERVTKDPNADASQLKMSAAEYDDFIKGEWTKFNQLIAKAVKEFADAKVDLEFEPLSEDAFTKLLSSNSWDVSKAMILGDLIVE